MKREKLAFLTASYFSVSEYHSLLHFHTPCRRSYPLLIWATHKWLKGLIYLAVMSKLKASERKSFVGSLDKVMILTESSQPLQ